MRAIQLVPLALAALLAGCGDAGKVKDSKMKGWPQYTIGQLLDKRQVCNSTKWHSFKDKRDRKIVEYVCDYAPAKAYLEKTTAEMLESFERSRLSNEEHEANMIVQMRQDLEKGIESHNAVLAGHEALQRGEYEPLQIALRDRQVLATVRSCSDLNPEAFGGNEMRGYAQRLSAGCTLRGGAVDVADMAGALETIIKIRQRELKNSVEDIPRQISISESKVQMLRNGLDERLAQVERATKETEHRLSDKRWLKARLEAFEGVKEISQWTIVDGEPTYVGSRVDVLFKNQPVEVPVQASFVFDQAADDPAGMSPLYERLLKQMLNEFKDPVAK